MARQTLRERARRYKERRLIEFRRIQKFLVRLERRILNGRHLDRLTEQEQKRVINLLFKSIIPFPLDYEVFGVTKARFIKDKRAYYSICKILREAGSRPQPRATSIIIRRRSGQILKTQIPETE